MLEVTDGEYPVIEFCHARVGRVWHRSSHSADIRQCGVPGLTLRCIRGEPIGLTLGDPVSGDSSPGRVVVPSDSDKRCIGDDPLFELALEI